MNQILCRAMRSSCAAVALVATLSAMSHAGPRLTMYESAFNFGYMPQGIAVSHTFWLHSTGGDPLKILRVDPGCSCTQAPLDKSVIPMGDSARLEIIFNSKTMIGPVNKTPKITTNSNTPQMSLQILGNVVAKVDSTYPLSITPWIVEMSSTSDSLAVLGGCQLENVSSQPLRIKRITTDETYYTATVPLALAPKGTARILIAVSKGYLRQSFAASLTLEVSGTDEEEVNRFTIPIKYNYRPK